MDLGADFALALCTATLISSKLRGMLLNFSPGAAGHTIPADSLRGIFLSVSEYVSFMWVASCSFCAGRTCRAYWYGSLKKRSWFFFLWLHLFLALSALRSADLVVRWAFPVVIKVSPIVRAYFIICFCSV